MKVLIESPHQHLKHVLDEFKVKQPSRRSATRLIPDPTKAVDARKYPSLEIIATPSTGTNHIDLLECLKRGIKVRSLLDDRDGMDEIRASSEFALFMILSALRHGGFRQWRQYDRQPEVMRGHELYGKLVGILGFGRIGRNVASWVQGMGARWRSYDYGSGDETLLEIFTTCDIVLISMSLNEKSKGLITRNHLLRLKDNAILVNVARAEIIREDDLYEWAALRKGVYAADVLHHEVEGDVKSPLLSLTNCIIYPHIAGTTYESEEQALRIALKLLQKEVEIAKK